MRKILFNFLLSLWLVTPTLLASQQTSKLAIIDNRQSPPTSSARKKNRNDCSRLRAIRHLLDSPVRRQGPQYPEEAKRKGVSGTVEVLVYVDEVGKVYKATVCKGHPLLRGAALDAAYKAVFAPTNYKGKPTKFATILTYSFREDN